MKVIDFHVHVGTKEHWNPWVMDFFRQTNPFYYERFSEKITPEGLITYLKFQGVEKAVILSEYAPNATGVVTNEFTVNFCRGHSELIPFGSISLYDHVSVEEQAERAIKVLGVKGFKMLPTYAYFYPNDPSLYPFYEVVQSYDLPIIFHTGTSIFKGSRVKYGDPLFLDDVAEDFPRLKIIVEHGGRPFWYDRAAWLITRHRNVYIGIAGIPASKLLASFPNLERYPDRFIFGSDWPGVPGIKPLVEKILSLPLAKEVKEMILWKNASEILQL
ncbi:MAG: amidohydrolase [Deltaproteobacteria bacterium]|nr:MAG: amidohydrolase [Deltaproteobacteria bacterium]